MNREDVIIFLRYSVLYSSIILRAIKSEDKRHAMNEGHSKAHKWEVRIHVFGVSVTGEPILLIGPKPMFLFF